jgi:hypothetical protein
MPETWSMMLMTSWPLSVSNEESEECIEPQKAHKSDCKESPTVPYLLSPFTLAPGKVKLQLIFFGEARETIENMMDLRDERLFGRLLDTEEQRIGS